MKRERVVRAWLVGLSLFSVAVGAGCGGAGAAAIGRAAGRGAAGVGRTAPVVRPAVYVPPPVHVPPPAYRPPPVTGNQFRVGNRVDRGAANGDNGFAVHGHLPDVYSATKPDDDRRKK